MALQSKLHDSIHKDQKARLRQQTIRAVSEPVSVNLSTNETQKDGGRNEGGNKDTSTHRIRTMSVVGKPPSRRAQKRMGLLKPARKIPQESDLGYIEYKWKMCDFQGGPHRRDKLASQMTFRLFEGEGKAVYNIGYTDEGHPVGLPYNTMLKSLHNFGEICEEVGGAIRSIKIFQGNEEKFYCANIFIEKDLSEQDLSLGADLLHSSLDDL